MGQYHIPVNIDKREFINPHLLNNGLKMLEWGCGGGTTTALTVLLACSHQRGGGDLITDNPAANKIMGRWAGDRIVVLGDYTEVGDPGTEPIFEMQYEPSHLQFACRPPQHPFDFVHENFKDISMACREVIRMDHWLAEEISADLPDYLASAADDSLALTDL